jgi:predicted RNA-binding protein YlxR (DUF448 family)
MPAQQSTTSRRSRPVAKHVPERTCVACRTSRPKRHLVRVVRTAEGGVEVDRTGRKAGRGAYLCPAQECFRLAKTRKSLDQALAVTVSGDTWEILEDYAQRLPEARL